jgi:hypothetical protein
MSFIFVFDNKKMLAIRNVKDIIEAINKIKTKFDPDLLNSKFECHPF